MVPIIWFLAGSIGYLHGVLLETKESHSAAEYALWGCTVLLDRWYTESKAGVRAITIDDVQATIDLIC